MFVGFGRGMRKALAAWYLSREPLELAKIVGFCKSKHGRSHKDILSLSHVKSEDGSKFSVHIQIFITYYIIRITKNALFVRGYPLFM